MGLLDGLRRLLGTPAADTPPDEETLEERVLSSPDARSQLAMLPPEERDRLTEKYRPDRGDPDAR